MARIQLILDNEVNKALRIYLGSKGFKKGDLSKFIEKLIVKALKKK